MTKKLIVLSLILLLPITIWAQSSVTFDFSTSSSDDAVPPIIKKDGITLKFSALSKEFLSDYHKQEKSIFLRLKYKGLLSIESKDYIITSIKFITYDRKHLLKVYNGDKLSIKKFNKNNDKLYLQEWSEHTSSISFAAFGGYNVDIKSIKVTYVIPIAISSAERATLYYSDKSFIIPKGIVARTYKIEGNVLSQSKEYKEGNVLPKGTAVVLEAKEGNYFFEETNKTGDTDPDNVLRGSDNKTMTTGGKVYYVFGKGSNGVGFYWKEPDGKVFTTEAHKAYLAYSPSTTAHAKSFLGFDVALGIEASSAIEKVAISSPIYNLAGQQVDKDYKGIVIVNGKKYLNR